MTDPVRFTPSGVWVTTPEVTDRQARVVVRTELSNHRSSPAAAVLETRLVDPSGVQVAVDRQTLELVEETATCVQALTVPDPQRWSCDSPSLYQVRSELQIGGQAVDRVVTRFGIREIAWETDTGFWLNGENVKLRGVCEHLEGGPVGAAWPRPLIRWKLQLLKAMGCNAVRTAHNPQVPEFYDLCDELGLMVMDEVFDGWKRKALHDYGAHDFAEWWERDLRDFLKRDRNHPSIVIWSVGNETGGPVADDLVRVCHQLDPTRPVTSGHAGSPAMDVFGVNGHSEKQEFYRRRRPNKPFVATENPHTWQVRDFYRTTTWFRDGFPGGGKGPFPLPDLTTDEVFSSPGFPAALRTSPKQVFNSSYDNATVRVSARKSWQLTRDLPWFSGSFRWTGFDYAGEAAYVHGGWPFRAFMGGAIDLAGFPKDLYYFYQSQWTDEPMVHLLPHWTHPSLNRGTKIPVWAYSNADEVELRLNGKPLGRDRPGRQWDQMQCEWLVPWEPGTLEAIAFRDGREVARSVRRTAEPPAGLRTTLERVEQSDCFIATTQVIDQAGVRNPTSMARVHYHPLGGVRILSVESGSPIDTEPNTGVASRHAFFGLNRAFLQTTDPSRGASLLVAAIVAPEPGAPQDAVSFACELLPLQGDQPAGQPEVRYTLDGSEPTEASALYREPFPMVRPMTIRAAVYAGGERLFEMREPISAEPSVP